MSRVIPLPSRCTDCQAEHEELVIVCGGHPHAGVIAFSRAKDGLVRLRCKQCGKMVADIISKEMIDHGAGAESQS